MRLKRSLVIRPLIRWFSRVSKPLFVGVLIASVMSGTTNAVAEELKTPRKILTGWIPYYSMKTSLPSTLNNVDLISEVMPFWYTLKYNGSQKKIVVSDLYTPANPSVPIANPLASLRAAGLKIIPTITDGTQKLVLSKELANPASRTRLATDITNFVLTNNFDGIDLDLENFAFLDGNASWATTQPHWVAFVKELGTQLRAKNKLLSITSPVVFFPTDRQKGYTVYAWAQIAPFIDRLRIMTYDFSIANPGPIGPLAWTERSVQYAISVIPASKVFLGLPAYGRDWVTKVDGICPQEVASVIKPGAKAAAFVQRNALSLAQTYNVTPSYNQTFGEATFTYQKVYNGQTTAGLATSCTATRTVWYQDVKSFTTRAELVGKYRLGGVAQWTLGMEDLATSQAVREVARSIAPDKVVATLSSNKSELGFGEVAGLSGQFTLPDKTPVVGLKVWLEILGSDAQWKQVHQGITGSDGSISIPLLPSRPSSMRLYSEGSWDRLEAFSSNLDIKVNRRISVSAPSYAVRGTGVTITGSIYPRTAGTTINVQSPASGSKIVATTLTDAQGNYSLTLPLAARSLSRFQIVVPADSQWAQTISSPFTILVK